MGLHFYHELVNFFSHRLKDREAANDVVQESYARVLAMPADAAVLDLRALLYRTGKNIVIDAARARQAETRMLDALALLCPTDAPSAERTTHAREQLRLLERRLQALPRKRRDAFVLVRIYGYTHLEAAAHMATTVGAIEKHVVRAICELTARAARDH